MQKFAVFRYSTLLACMFLGAHDNDAMRPCFALAASALTLTCETSKGCMQNTLLMHGKFMSQEVHAYQTRLSSEPACARSHTGVSHNCLMLTPPVVASLVADHAVCV